MSNVIALPQPQKPAAPPKKRGGSKGFTKGWNPWPGVRGGRIYLSEKNVLSFYVDRSIDGVKYRMVNLHASDAESAIIKFRRWEENPAGFNTHGAAPANAVTFSEQLVTAYVRWCSEVPPGKVRRRNTDPNWIARKRTYLSWWALQLRGRNLRSDGSVGSVTTDDIKAALKDAKSYRHRLEAIKAFYGFLRSEAPSELRVQRHHDPTDAIPIPKPDAAQARPGGSKVAWSKQDAEKVIRWLTKAKVKRLRVTGRKIFDVEQAAAYLGMTVGTVHQFASKGKLKHEGGGHGNPLVFQRSARDAYDRRRAEAASVPRRVALALTVLGGTLWHVTEVVRFSKNGTIEDLPPDHVRQNGAVKVLTCLHKGGFTHPSAVTERVAKAAAELQRLGGISANPIYKWCKRAVEQTKAAPFKPGRFRHRGATMQKNVGVDQKKVGKNLGHKSTSTTTIYDMLGVEPKLPTWF